MLNKKIYDLICFFFFFDVIELILCFFVGYSSDYILFAAFRKKKHQKTDIAEIFENYKQRMAEKPTIETQLKNLTIQVKEPRKEFLLSLSNKLNQKFPDCEIAFDIHEKLISFSFETFILNSKPLAEKLIDTVDDHIKKEFFSSQGLGESALCTKYMLHSEVCGRANGIKTQLVQFIWFRNLYRHKLCPCFVCDSFGKKYDC